VRAATAPVLSPTPAPFRLRDEMNGMGDAPGKVWFFELAAAVIDAERCVRCGACIAACPTDSIGVNEDDLPQLVKMCTGCSLCWDFCPRGGLNYESTWLPTDGLPQVITGASGPTSLGAVRAGYQARVKADSKYRAATGQDGAVVSALLVAALEQGLIDGALVARVDPTTPWRAIPYFARSRYEILAAAGSFYNQTLALGALDFDRLGLGSDARVAVVGTPCEIQGIRALQRSSWEWGTSRPEAISLTIALLCTKSFDYRRLMLDELVDKREIDLAQVAKVDVIHGRFLVFDREGAALVDEPVKAFHGAALKGCDECADFLGRAADLSVGSVGSPDGWSSLLVRTEVGAHALSLIEDELELGAIERPDALEKLDQLDKRIAGASLHRPFDPDGPMFTDFAEHLRNYAGSDRAPRWPER
jgi:coenzyme F420 hydrogenase subunit beta